MRRIEAAQMHLIGPVAGYRYYRRTGNNSYPYNEKLPKRMARTFEKNTLNRIQNILFHYKPRKR
jgi:hypothetical protein